MFAGPNGSGKSTLKSVLSPELLGVYLNPDDIERELKAQGFLNIEGYDVKATEAEVRAFFRESSFLREAGFSDLAEQLSLAEGRLDFGCETTNSYVASATADFLRQRLLERRASFTLETVMSHSGKVALLEHAQRIGYRTYLYFIATDDPEINISRVRNRVRQGGHPVPEEKIVKRYHLSLSLLVDAIRNTNRAYVFDNSGEGKESTWIAEITEGKELEMRADQMPAWFKHAVWEKIVLATPPS